MINFDKLTKMLDDALSKETSESWSEKEKQYLKNRKRKINIQNYDV